MANLSKSKQQIRYNSLILKEGIFIPLILTLAAIFLSTSLVADEVNTSNSEAKCPSWLNHSVKKLHSTANIDLCELTKGKPVLVVNTASHCGYTRQFSGLEALHKQYQEKGLVVVGFPSNSFNQESDDEAETANICYKNFGVSFAMTQKVSVKGSNAHPVFEHLAKQSSAPSWNFNKYLISANGELVQKFSSSVEPMDNEITSRIEKLL